MGNNCSKLKAKCEHTVKEATQDTSNPVIRKKNDQGLHECEVFGSGLEAAESEYAWANCSKNPGHTSFIPVNDFSLDHLPERCRKDHNLEYIFALSNLTVRLRVNYTSMERPDGYTFSQSRGLKIPHVGSGWVDTIRNHSNKNCPCPECVNSSSPYPQWFEIFVYTACHVVYNTEEANSTTVDFLFDDKEWATNGMMWSVLGREVRMRNLNGDTCRFTCATHDIDLYLFLNKALHLTMCYTFTSDTRLHALLTEPSWFKMVVVIISHPHGRSKHITVGDLIRFGCDKNTPSDGLFHDDCLVYRADSCPGSSGALVLTIGSTTKLFTVLPHSGCVDQEIANYSAGKFLSWDILNETLWDQCCCMKRKGYKVF